MNIWVIGRSYPTKQNQMRGSFELEQAKLLAKHGHHVCYVAAIFHPIKKVKKWGYCHFKDDTVQVYTESVFYAPDRMHVHMPVFQGKIWEKLLSKVEKEEGFPDIIHIHYPGMVSVPGPFLAYKRRGAGLVTTDHWSQTLNNTMDNFQRKQLITYAKQADAVLCVGGPLKEAVRRITGIKKEITVVPNVVSASFSCNRNKEPSEIFNFIAVGRIEPVKQMDKITETFAKEFAGKENVHLTIVGDGKERSKVTEIIDKYKIQNQVHLTGTLSREATAEKVKDADALICYGKWETFGVPIIEGWACGKPVIFSRNVGVIEYWNEELGCVVDQNDPGDLGKAMKYVYANIQQYDAKKIAKFAEENFNEETVYNKLLAVYTEIKRSSLPVYCMANHKRNKETAGAKAPDDITSIAGANGAELVDFYAPHEFKNRNLIRLAALFSGTDNWRRLQKQVVPGACVIIQHPNQGIRVSAGYMDKLKKEKDIHFIALIHDLNSLRKMCGYDQKQLVKRDQFADEVILKKCDCVICHNDSMKKYLLERGFNEEKLISLEIFDYLHDCNLPDRNDNKKSVTVAGNLRREKCEYIYKLCESDDMNFTLNLYGPDFKPQKTSESVIYHGSFPPEELPEKMEGSFGLVWDGTETDRCAGNAGEYIRYNNPHKCSLFLSCNMPVIIWKEAALAEFVEKNKAGITVNSLWEISSALDSLSDEEYREMVRNATVIGEKMRQGYYFRTALEKAIKLIGKEGE